MDDLAPYRKQIDELDRQIVELLLRRAQAASHIGDVKRRKNEPVYRPDREQGVYDNILNYAREIRKNWQGPETLPELPDSAFRNIYREIMSGSIALEGGPQVGYLGPPGSFSHMATRYRFGNSVRGMPMDTIPEIFRTVANVREASYGVVPADNTAAGSVGITMDCFLDSSLQIYAEQFVRVRHHLLGVEEIPLQSVRKIYTIPIGLEQCKEWVNKHLPMHEIQIVETSSTARAAQLVAQNKDGLAIASELASEIYGLKIVSPDIQDSSDNITRFWIIGHEQCPPGKRDRTSLVLSFHDEPGGLFRVLKPFYDANINMTRIESRATRKNYGEYNFFIDLEGHREAEPVRGIIQDLEKCTSFLKVLGSYPMGQVD
ncbi:MAG: prephenate dehydratase [Leptospiraceae bacterium]|nr:prephenate dehydratase [Leptospiraceae bacterium]